MQKFSAAIFCALGILALSFIFGGATAKAVDAAPTATPIGTPTAGSSSSSTRHPPATFSPSQASAASAAPGYCSSTGGSPQYENISGAFLTPNGDGTMKLQLNVFIANPEGCVAGQECPSYDPSPEHVNAWIDWNGDKVWDPSERVMDKDLFGHCHRREGP